MAELGDATAAVASPSLGFWSRDAMVRHNPYSFVPKPTAKTLPRKPDHLVSKDTIEYSTIECVLNVASVLSSRPSSWNVVKVAWERQLAQHGDRFAATHDPVYKCLQKSTVHTYGGEI